MDRLESKKLAVIGGGHIGLALVEGFINSGKIPGSQLIVANPTLAKVVHLKKMGVEITSDNTVAVSKADWIFLAVKPFVVDRVLTEIGMLTKGKLLISLAAAVGVNTLKKRLKNTKVIRIMPNMAIAYNKGVIGLLTKRKLNKLVKSLLSVLGVVVEVKKEEHLDALTVLTGCGPAIVAQFLEMLANYGTNAGISSNKSYVLALQTFEGAIAFLKNSALSPDEFIRSVATKGGITEAILSELKHKIFQNAFTHAMDQGYSKIEEIKQAAKLANKHSEKWP